MLDAPASAVFSLGCRNGDVTDVTLTHQVWSRPSRRRPPVPAPANVDFSIACQRPGGNKTHHLEPFRRSHGLTPGGLVLVSVHDSRRAHEVLSSVLLLPPSPPAGILCASLLRVA